ncbi:outer membrane beta-barrel protein [Acinetobacter kookii]|uniref:Outer membrane protein n=1 Tax=Acinetobacter kookii TaxID=1226327 RepID=A0A1G6MNM1_9GAMM|nr:MULTISPECIES: OmpW family outer membrane protein [Acinetobacter]MCT8089414.1 outer membrane beta-barrel protein [Acinetobacter sp. F_3_1]MCT8098218.1 outer membrane beta-barrel protein [Acinetobacter sp. C_3_1]MCT8101133.1 outer membrane beta-barrel protein [Acinetobacter sp. C_4_1]MCT8134885.1 outer membrane beta-barrel protein [Acinetobacter sp. T_3_1]TCB72107.1 OmpW family protein [Acinetobacter sp. ANC 4216]
MLKQVALIALLGMSASAMAGQWQVKVGASSLAPTEDQNVLANGAFTNVEASQEYGFTPSVEYFFNDNFSAELLLATPFEHDVTSNGTKIASFKHLPPTITAKYNFKNSTGFTPYVGVGATVVIPWDEEIVIDGAKLNADVGYGVAGQVGFNFQPADAKNWGVFADVRYADVKSELELNGNAIGDLEVNPWVYTLGYSYKF